MANIMIVDDAAIIRRSLREILETAGHRIVREAEDGSEAIEAYKKEEIDLITMDIQLPGIDGIEAVRQIRERHPEAAIVMISSLEQRSKVYEAIKHGAKHYITKPFTADKVLEVVHAVLRQQANDGGRVVNEPIPAAVPVSAPPAPPMPARELLKLETPSLAAVPFELTIKEDRPELTVTRHINDSNVRYWHSCLQGLLYFRKAKYVVILTKPLLHDEGMQLLREFVRAVQERSGTVGIVAEDTSSYTRLKAHYPNHVFRQYEEIGW